MDALIATLTGQPVLRREPLQGGSVSEVSRVTLADTRRMVAKTGPLVLREGQMLQAMAASGAPVPEVIAMTEGLLLIEWIDQGPATTQGWAAFGAGLARLHHATGPHYGWEADYAFGPQVILNAPSHDWIAFWSEQRLMPIAATLPPPLARRIERICTRLPDLIPAQPAPALLHGDLWGGNVLFGRGTAHLIDPACYHGDGEVDLAMLELFDHPAPAFWSAYGRPAGDWPTRRAVYQLWPALVHLRLFGTGYLPLLEARLTHLGG